MRPDDDASLTRRTVLAGAGTGLAMAGALGALGGGARLAVAAQATPIAWPPIDDMVGVLVIRRYRLKGDVDYADFTARVREGYIPLIEGVPGFRAYYFGPAGGEMREHVAVAVFDDPAGAEESTARAGDWAAQNVADLVELPAYEVISMTLTLEATAEVPATGVESTPES